MATRFPFSKRLLFLIFFFILVSAPGISQPIIPVNHPHILLNDSLRTRLTTALTQNQPSAVRFREMVDDQLSGGDVYAFQGWHAALLYQLTGNASYGTYAVNFIDDWVISEEALIDSGKRAEVAFDSYLYIRDYIGDLALVYDWCYPLLSENQKTRWRAYANQAVWNVWHPDSARWGGISYPWSGWSVNNPMNNYYYSFLHATMFLGLAEYGDDPKGSEWITFFRNTKMDNQLFPAFAGSLTGGGSREGTGYGISHKNLFELYFFWEESTGERICDRTSHARESLLYSLHVVVPTLDWVAPIGDHARESTGALFDYQREYVAALTRMYQNDPIARYGKYFLTHCSISRMTHQFEYVYDFLYDVSSIEEAPLSDLDLMYYAQGVGHIFARSSWETNAVWLNLIAGPFDESHAHRDQGSLMIYRNEWLADDQNRRTHSGIQQGEQLHNLVRIDNQSGQTAEMAYDHSSEVIALRDKPEYTYAAVDISPMYSSVSFVSRVEREMVFIRPSTIVLFDRVDGESASSRIWQLNTPYEPSITGPNAVITGAHSSLSIACLSPAGASFSVTDWLHIGDTDMNSGYRLDITHAGGDGTSRFLNVLSLDGAVVAAVPDDTGTQRGVNIQFAHGGSASVHFENNTWGGHLLVRDSGNTILVDTALSSGTTHAHPTNANILHGYRLFQNYPNPFNPQTVIYYSIPHTCNVQMKVYDLLGREIMTLFDGIQTAGEHRVEWNGSHSTGKKVSGGVYYYQLKSSDGFVSTKKMLLIK